MIHKKWDKCISVRFLNDNAGGTIRKRRIINLGIHLISSGKGAVLCPGVIVRHIVNNPPVYTLEITVNKEHIIGAFGNISNDGIWVFL